MDLTAKQYDHMTKRVSKNSRSAMDIFKAFLIGGLICTFGHFLTNVYMGAGLTERNAGTVTSITLIFLSAMLTGLHLYHKIAKHGGAGTLVPITGFANAMVSPAHEFKSEGLILGLGAKLFLIAGPVIVYGVTASVLYGIIIYLFKLY